MIAELLIGAVVSLSSGLGYERPAYGGQVSGSVGRLRGELRTLSVEKSDGGSGSALTGWAEARVIGTERIGLHIGADGVYQRVERYESERISPRASAVVCPNGKAQVSAYWIGSGQKIRRIVGASVLVGERPAVQVDAEMIRHDDGDGNRVSVALLWRF